MKSQTTSYKVVLALSYVLALILVLLPFHAFLTVWLSSLFSHYTLIRLWKEFLLLALVVGVAFLVAKDKEVARNLLKSWLVRLVGIYCVLVLICGLTAWISNSISTKAIWYGLLVDLRFFAVFLVAVVLSAKSSWLSSNWQRILLVPALLVATFAILQYWILPYDFLKHFGYGTNTISPYETINHNIRHLRVASTLRGANPLGAYLIVPICALAALISKDRKIDRRRLIFGVVLLLALVFSFSRSAWIGAFAGTFTIIWLSLNSKKARKNILFCLSTLVIFALALAIGLRNNTGFENSILHTDYSSTALTSSNQGHTAAFRYAISDVYHHPLGSGVGSAGPQSVYNNNKSKIAENYYLQVGQEAGVLGMILFVAIIIFFGRYLYKTRDNTLALALFGTLIGLVMVNFLSHAWEDDTLAYIWWGLAGIALAPAILADRRNRNVKTQKAT